ncbi:zinc finger CCCH domain-containing protein 44-like isoform X2 [Phragmites australis]|uniref:zinc finger CCCH domain-containing protein 44-like isoform X2 n=1 Tax=Phragmites australis TaxID=29695 RepID=UPI002D794A15|nr:zinc finger CCCH domain-containing protein 44-like isoform X2 [Phragmites australis]
MGRKRKGVAEEIADAEEYCFTCKDGGSDLRVCDFKNCLKAYHPRCTGKGDDFLTSDEQFICNWHTCGTCKGSSDYQCLCCPLYSVCRDCLGKVDFAQVRRQGKGFCGSCLKLAILSEKNADANPHGAKIGYRGSEIYESLFKDYWDVIKDRECLTLVDLQEASVLIDRSRNCKRGASSEKFPEEDHKSDGNLLDDNDDNEQTFPFDSKGKPNKVNTSLKKRKSNKKTYVGWGSEELIEFLSCFGKDIAKPLDEVEVVGVVKEYIRQKNLFLDNKKKNFRCDDKLRSLFKRSKVRWNKIHRFLEMHFAANAVSEDESLDGSEDDDGPTMKKKPRTSLEPKIAKRVSEQNKRCFASLNQNNLKLIYLRRSLVIKLLSHPDTFEQKVVGCFVRVKNNPTHHYQMFKKAYQIGLVTGIKKSSEDYKIKDTFTNVVLCVTGLWDDVKISMLSDEDFEEDECNDLIPLVEKGLLKRATVAELEEKVAAVHTDIVNHWIDKELLRLEKEIDRAHIKGWRIEMEELMHQKKLLSTPAERQCRLEEVPEIIVDSEEEKKEIELKIAADNPSQENRDKKRDRASCLVDNNNNNKASCLVDMEKNSKGATEQVVDALNIPNEESSEGAEDQGSDSLRLREEGSPEGATEKIAYSLRLLNKESSEVASKQGDATCEVASEDGSTAQAMDIDKDESNHSRRDNGSNKVVVNLDSDEDGDLHTEQREPEREALHAPTAMNGGDLHVERPVSGLPVALHADGADGSTAQAMDIDKDESNHSRRDNGSNKVVVNLDSDEDGDLHTEQREPEREALHAPTAMNGGDLHVERPVSGPPVALHADGAMNRALHAEQGEPTHAATNGMSPLTPQWHYVDPQGISRGPFSLMHLRHWKRGGFFGEDFRVWRTGQAVEQAILLTDAFRLNL